MERKKLEDLAEERYYEALELKDENIQRARKKFAISYGFYTHLEDTERMKLCIEQLRNTGLLDIEVRLFQRFGYDVAISAIEYTGELRV